MPTTTMLAGHDPLVVIGSLADIREAVELSGVVKLALERTRGALVFAYPVHLGPADDAFLQDFGHPLPFGNTPNAVRGYPSEFHAFFTQYGVSGAAFYRSQVAAATVLGSIRENDGTTAPTALCWETSTRGVTYTIPYHISAVSNAGHMLETLLAAVAAHRDSLTTGLPPYLTDIRLGAVEINLLDEMVAMEGRAEEMRVAASHLARWRHLVGRSSGAPLVALVVEALNAVFGDTGYRAEQRAEEFAEDFWIVDPSGNDFALGEAKGQGGGVARADVGQVDSHREHRGLQPDFPGLLVVNAFRNDPDLARKQADLAPNVELLARPQNVVVMRSWDLYQLLGRTLDGEDVAAELISALGRPGGGWFKVTADGFDFRHRSM